MGEEEKKRKGKATQKEGIAVQWENGDQFLDQEIETWVRTH